MTVATARATMADLVPRLVLRVACCSMGAPIRCTQVQQDMSWGYHLDGNLGTTKSHAPAPVSGGVGRRGEPGQDMAGVRTEKAGKKKKLKDTASQTGLCEDFNPASLSIVRSVDARCGPWHHYNPPGPGPVPLFLNLAPRLHGHAWLAPTTSPRVSLRGCHSGHAHEQRVSNRCVWGAMSDDNRHPLSSFG